ncbi:unnamed protein product [Effrenium voratum]|nr:unnamed protein product [Effrenium voratum]
MAEETFRGVCREALMASINSSHTVCVEDLQGEVCAMQLSQSTMEQILKEEKRRLDFGRREREAGINLRVAPFPPDVLGDQTPLVGLSIRTEPEELKRRSPERRRRRERRDEELSVWGSRGVVSTRTESAASLLPAPSLAHQMPMPGDNPSVFLLEGFRVQNLNQAFHVNAQILVCGHPTYWDRERNYFMYFHEQDRRWVISPRKQHGSDRLIEAQNGVMMGCAFQHLGDVWQELIGEDWKDAPQVRVKSLIEHAVRATSLTAGALPLPARDRPSASSKPALSASKVPSTLPSTLPPQSKQAFAVDTVQIRGGFHTPELNAVYFLDSSLQIGSRATYWDERRRFFMYYQAALKRWAISVHDAESTGEDMLENAKRGGLCGFAFEVDKSSNQWMEHCEGKWINVKIDIQKLCTGRRASVTQDINKSLLTSSTPRVPETPETRDTSREVTFAMPLKAASALVPAAPAASVAPAAPVAPGATVAAPARASVAPVTAPSAAAPVVASPPAPKTDSPMVAQLVLAEAETTAPDMRQGHEEKNLQAEQEAEGGEDELSTDPEVKVEKDKKERKKDKDSKKAKKLEKQERARRKENKLKEKLRQEMLAARANKSKVRGEHVSKKQSASPKKRHEADKAKRRRVEASAAEKPAAKGAPRPRWAASAAAKWPAFWAEDQAKQASNHAGTDHTARMVRGF